MPENSADHDLTAGTGDRQPSMVQIVEALSETYTDDGVAIVLSAPHKALWPDRTTAEVCRTAEGRAEVFRWAYSLGEMIAT